jgi:hypothetical protein
LPAKQKLTILSGFYQLSRVSQAKKIFAAIRGKFPMIEKKGVVGQGSDLKPVVGGEYHRNFF